MLNMMKLIVQQFKNENMLSRIQNKNQYDAVMQTIESLLEKATKKGGFHHLSKEEGNLLASLSKLAESYEDNVMKLMPLKPTTLQEAVSLKMMEGKLNQAGLAKKLGIGTAKLSQILNGKRKPDLPFLKAVHKKLQIDAEFILTHA